MAPGEVYSDLRSLKLGDKVQAKDKGGHWYNAKIIAKRSSGTRTSVTVRYVSFSKAHDESFTAKQQKVRERLPKKETDAENAAGYFHGWCDHDGSLTHYTLTLEPT